MTLYQRLASIVRLSLVGVLIFPPALVNGQITPEGGQQATVDSSFNDKPDILNIASPDGSGLSHNKFTDFNVKTDGLVINNSSVATTSDLAGAVFGNPNLGDGTEASLILNEVTSGNPSQLLGFQELVGGSAEYIVANPNGITCNGCGFINFPRVTLGTGTPTFAAGTFAGLDVTSGQILISGNGVDTRTADMFDLVARTIVIDGQINTEDLAVFAGGNDYDYAGRTATAQAAAGGTPTYAVDSTALGGIFARRIRLIANEAGVGVRMRGDMAATVDSIVINSNGVIEFTDNQVSAQRAVNLTAATNTDFTNTNIQAGRNLTISGADHRIDGGSSVGADLNLTITGDSLTVRDAGNEIFADRDVTVNVTGAISLENVQLEADDDLNLTGNNISLSNNSEVIGAADAFRGSGSSGSTVITENGTAVSVDSTSLLASGTSLVVNSSGAFSNAGLASADQGVVGKTSVAIDAASITNSGNIHAVTGLTLTGDTAITNQATGVLSTDTGVIQLAQAVGQTVTVTNVSGGVIVAPTVMIDVEGMVNAGQINNTGASTTLDIDLATLTNSGDITAVRDIDLDITQITNNSGGKIAAGRDLDIGSNGFIDNNAGATLSAARDVTVNTQDTTPPTDGIFNDGLIFAGDELVMLFVATYQASSTTGQIFARNDITLGASTAGVIGSQILTNDFGSIESWQGDITINVDTLNNRQTADVQQAEILAGNDITINFVTELNNEASLISAGNDITIDGDPDGDMTGGQVSNDDPNGYDTAVIEAVNNVTISNASQVGNGTAGVDAGAGATADQSDPDSSGPGIPGVNISLPSNPNGIFVTPQDPNANFLIETNPDFNLKALFGSDYLLVRLGYDPEEFRRLGDNFYEINLIRDQVVAQFGLRFILENVDNEDDQYKILMDNAASVKGDLNLTLGVALTKEQVAQLTKDIVWLVEMEVNGQKVLVPRVYISDATKARLQRGADGGLMLAHNIDMRNIDRLINAGGIRADNNLTIQANEEIVNIRGLMEADKTVDLSAQQNIVNLSGKIKGRNVFLEAKDGDVINETLVRRKNNDRAWFEEQSAKYSGSWFDVEPTEVLQYEDVVDNVASIEAEEFLDIDAGRSILLKGAELKAGKSAVLDAGSTIAVENIELEKESKEFYRSNPFSNRREERTVTETKVFGSSITTGENLIMNAEKGNILIQGSNVEAGETAVLQAGANIAIIAAQDKVEKDRAGGFLGFLAGKETTRTDVGSNVSAGDNLYIVADKDIRNEDSSITAGTKIIDDPENAGDRTGDLLIYSEEGGFNNYTYGLDGNPAEVVAAGDLTIVTQKDIGNYSGLLGAGEDVTLVSREGDIKNITNVYREGSSKNYTDYAGDIATITGGGDVTMIANQNVDIVGGDVSGGNSLALVAQEGDVNVVDQKLESKRTWTETKKESSGWWIFKKTKTTKTEHSSTSEELVQSSISGGEDGISIFSKNDTNIKAAKVLSEGDIDVLAQEGDINIESVTTSVTTEDTTTVTDDIMGIRTGGSEETLTNTDETVYGSVLAALGNVRMRSGGDTNIEASDLLAGKDIEINADGSVSIKAAKETDTMNRDYANDEWFARSGRDGSHVFVETGHQWTTEKEELVDETIHGSNVAAGGKLSIFSGNDLNIESSDLSSGKDMQLSALNDINITALSEDDSYTYDGDVHEGGFQAGAGLDKTDAGQFYQGEEGNIDYSEKKYQTSSLTSGGNLTVTAGRDIYEEATEVSAAKNIAVNAGRDFTSEAVQDETNLEISGVKRRQDLGVGIKLGMEDTVADVVGLFDKEDGENLRGDEPSPFLNNPGINYGVNAEYQQSEWTQTESSSIARVSNWTSGGNTQFNAGNNATLVGSQIESGGKLIVNAGGDLNLLAAEDSYSTSNEFAIYGGEMMGDPIAFTNAYAGGGYIGESESESSTTARVVSLKSGDDMSLKAGGDMELEGIEAESDGDMELNAGGDIDITAARNTYERTQNDLRIQGELGYSATGIAGEVQVEVEDDVENLDLAQTAKLKSGGNFTMTSGGDATLEGTEVDVDGNASVDAGGDLTFNEARDTYTRERTYVNVAVSASKAKKAKAKKGGGDTASTTRMGRAWDRAKTAGRGAKNKGEDVGRFLKKTSIGSGVNVDIETESADMDVGRGGFIKAGGDVNLKSGKDMKFVGTEVRSEGQMNIDAGDNLTIEAVETTMKTDQTKVAVGVGVLSGLGFDISDANYDATLYDNAKIVAGGDLAIKSGGDTTIAGANVVGETATVDVRGDLTIESKVSTEEFSGGGLGLGIGVGGQDTVAQADESLFYSGTKEDVTISGIQGREGLDVRVGNDTTLEGGYLIAEEGDVYLSTRSLKVSDVTAESEYGSFMTWDESSSKTARATVGSGLIAIRDGDTSYREKLNRSDDEMLVNEEGDTIEIWADNPNESQDKVNEYRDLMQGKMDDAKQAKEDMEAGVEERLEETGADALKERMVQQNLNNVIERYGEVENVPTEVQIEILKQAEIELPENATPVQINEAFQALVSDLE